MSILKLEPQIANATANFSFGNVFASNFYYANGTLFSGGSGGGGSFISRVDSFIGDGVTSSFTLSSEPAGLEYLLVTIGGVSQPRSSFTTSGNVLTFSFIPPYQSLIEVTSLGGQGAALGAATSVTSSFQPNITSVGTLISLNVSGNVTAPNFIGNASTAGTVTTNAQPNITSVGTLTSLTASGNITTTGSFVGDGTGLSNVATAVSVTSSSQPNITSVGTLTSLNIAGAFSSSSFSEPLVVISNAGGVVTHNFTTSSSFVHLTPANNFTPNFTNVPTTDNRIVVVACIIYQGATGYFPNAMQIDGFGYNVKWANGIAPLPTPNKVDIFSFTLVRFNSSWDVYGQTSTYAAV